MIKRILILVLALCALLPTSQAQKVGVGGMINNTSTGILFSYSPAWESKWNLDLGMRFFAKVNLVGKNDQSYAYYQQGHTESFLERFALNFRISHKITSYKMVRLDFMANLLLTCEGRLETGPTFGTDPTTGHFTQIWPFDYFKPSPAAELTIGPSVSITCSPKLTAYGAVGYGIIYMHHSHEGWSRTYNEPVYSVDLGPTANWKRGAYEFVGLEGLPMISVGLKYSLK